MRRFVVVVVILLAAALTFSGAAAQAQSGAGACAGSASVTPGLREGTLEAGGLTREYLIYVPESYDGTQAVPLVLSLHGFSAFPAQQMRDSGWNAIADRENFVVVYPAGTGAPSRWNAGQHELPGFRAEDVRGPLSGLLGSFFETVPADDVAFIRDLVGQLEADLCIDAARVYVNGMSNGGGMTNRLACEAADVFAAAGMVAGAYTDFGGCNPARPMPIVAFHGVEDPIVPYAGDERVRFPAVESWVADWAARDQCHETPETISGTVGMVTGSRYVGCAGNAEVDFYSIADGGHTWPGGAMSIPFLIGKTSQDIDASATMWAFFAAHDLE